MAVQLGLIGTGYWGPNVARSLVENGKGQLRWLCDLNAESLERTAARHPGVKTTHDFTEMLADPEVEAVAISTPTSSHFAIAKAALEAGKHVLIEKPITATTAEAEALTKLAEKNGRIVMVGHVFMYNAGIRAVKDLIATGEIGDVHYISFERSNLGPVRTDVNALWDLASHDISILCDLMSRPPDAVSATGQSFLNPGIEDVVFATFAYADGPQAHVHASWLNPRKVRHMTVVGSKKMILWDDLEMKAPVKVIDKHVEFPTPGQGGDTYIDFKTLCVEGDTHIPQVAARPPLQVECEHFLECIRSGTTPRSDGNNGAAVVRILEAATESLHRNGAYINCDGSLKPLPQRPGV